MSGIFEADIFAGPRRGMGRGLAAFGDLPEGAQPLATLSSHRARYPALPIDEMLRSKGATHYTMSRVGDTSAVFTFFNSAGTVVVSPQTLWAAGTDRPVEPTAIKEPSATPMARREGDGLLPSAAPERSSEPKWLPWVLIGGGALVAGGIIYAATRRPVAANRRRRKRRRRRRR